MQNDQPNPTDGNSDGEVKNEADWHDNLEPNLEELGPQCYNPPYFFPGRSPDPVTIHLPDKPPVLKDQPPIIFPSATPPDLMSK